MSKHISWKEVLFGTGVIVNAYNVFNASHIEDNYAKAMFFLLCLFVCTVSFAVAIYERKENEEL